MKVQTGLKSGQNGGIETVGRVRNGRPASRVGP